MQAELSALGHLQATVAYFLMADNRRRMPSSAYLRAELTEAHQAHQGYPPGAALLCCLLCCTALACDPCLCIIESPLEAVAEWQVSGDLTDACKRRHSLPCLLQPSEGAMTAVAVGDKEACSLQA